jgi:adenylate kinase family enzyme
MNIKIVIGRAQSGKTTFSRFLAKEFGEKTLGTSDIVYKAMAKARGCPLEELCRVPKELLRPHLMEFADYLCDIYPDILSEGIIQEGATIIDGVRRTEELLVLRQKYNASVYYVEREIGTVDDNFEIDISLADYVVDNNREIGDFIIQPLYATL